MTAVENSDCELLYAYFQACTEAEIGDPATIHPVSAFAWRNFSDLPDWAPAASAIVPPATPLAT
eukprot:7046122-Pyramimonas_sp.AAC.1